MKWILTTLKMKRKNTSRLSTAHLTVNPHSTLPNDEDQWGRGKSQNPYLSIQNERYTNGKNKPFWKQKAWEGRVGMSPLQMNSPPSNTYRLSSILNSSLGRIVTKNGCNVHDCVKRGFSQLSFIYVLFSFNIFLGGVLVVKALDCGIVVREFVLQSRYYVHFRANTLEKGMSPLNLPAMG